ncbi:MAG TPA: hypothetical protein VFX11_03995 [Candidatus Kapabacteria bacterium]|nr:hypothetical protein [Candidatus Kapabacteria bacterium]
MLVRISSGADDKFALAWCKTLLFRLNLMNYVLTWGGVNKKHATKVVGKLRIWRGAIEYLRGEERQQDHRP